MHKVKYHNEANNSWKKTGVGDPATDSSDDDSFGRMETAGKSPRYDEGQILIRSGRVEHFSRCRSR